MRRDYYSQRSDRLAVTQLPVYSLTHSLTQPLAARPNAGQLASRRRC